MKKQTYKNKVVWITGGGTGLGKAMAKEYAQKGAIAVVSGRRFEKLNETVAEIKSNGRIALAIKCDVSVEETIKSAVAEIVEKYGRLDIVVANAAFAVLGQIEEIELHHWQRQFNVNVFGAAMTVKHSLPELKKAKGRIAFITSAAALGTAGGVGVYSASKYAMRALGQTLSMELHESGVTSTVIYPGYMKTDFAKIDNNGEHDPNREFSSAMMWSPERAAKVTIKAIEKRKREYSFSAISKIWGFFGKHFPGVGYFYFTRFGIPGDIPTE